MAKISPGLQIKPIHQTAPSKALSVADDSFESVAGSGLENVGPRDLIIPRLALLQALSPQINSKKPEYISGSKVGDICDVGTQEIFDPPLFFLPVFYVKHWLEWAPRASSKGLQKIHDNDAILSKAKTDEKGRSFLENGNYISETAQFFGLNLSAAGRHSFLPMASTQLKKARRWLTLATSERAERTNGSKYTPPIFYRVYDLSVVDESNAEGDWAGWKIERGVRLQDFSSDWREIFDDAIKFRESLKQGKVRGDLDASEDPSVEAPF